MSRFISCLVAFGLVAFLAFPASAAQRTRTRSFSLTIEQATVESTGNPPVSGSEVAAGTVAGTYTGAEVAHIRFPAAGQFTATTRTYSSAGSVASTQKGTGQLNPDGSISGSGTGTITGGTGSFAGARGKFTFTFHGDKFGGPVTFKITGRITTRVA